MADVAQLLETLHPMREPPPPSPIAPFLVMLAFGILIATALAVVWFLARRHRVGLRRTALTALAATRGLEPGERLAAQARLLRRLVRARAGPAAARAEGGAWLATLDRIFATSQFTTGEGRAYAEALYRRHGAAEVESLDRMLATLIERGRFERPAA